MSFSFDLGTPFRPYQQLMGVLPAASMDLIPLAYRVSPYHLVDFSIILTASCAVVGLDVQPRLANP